MEKSATKFKNVDIDARKAVIKMNVEDRRKPVVQFVED